MPALSTDQWVVIAVIFALGLLLGLMLRSGGAKWRVKYQAEHQAHVALRREYDAHLSRHKEALPVERDRLRSGGF